MSTDCKKETHDKWGGLLIALCAVCYFVSYISRINYGAVILEIERSEDISKVAASMAVTGSFITYGFGQLISGVDGGSDETGASDLRRTVDFRSDERVGTFLPAAFADPDLLVHQWICTGVDVAAHGENPVGLSG